MRYWSLFFTIFMIVFIGCDKNDPTDNDVVNRISLNTEQNTFSLNDTINVELNFSSFENVSAFGILIEYPSEAFVIVEMNRIDDWLVSNGGVVLAVEFSHDVLSGKIKIVEAIVPQEFYVSDLSEIQHPVFELKLIPIQVGSFEISINADNDFDSDLGVYSSLAELVGDLDIESMQLTIGQ